MPIYDRFVAQHEDIKLQLQGLIEEVGPNNFKSIIEQFDWLLDKKESINIKDQKILLSEGIQYYLKSDLFQSYARTTKTAYEIEIKLFFEYCQDKQGENITIHESSNPLFISSYLQSSVKPATRNKKAAFLSSFLKELYSYYYNEEPTRLKRTLKSVKDSNRLPKALTIEQLNELLDIVRQSAESYRNFVILYTFLGSGMRLSELTSIQVEDIHLQDQIILVRAKGQKDTKVACRITKSALMLLMSYVNFRYKCHIDKPYWGKLYVFSKDKGINHIHESTIQKMFQHMIDQSTTIPVSHKHTYAASIHSLRHSFALLLLESGVSIYIIKELLRHRNITSTEVYLKLFDDTLIKAIENNNPFACLYNDVQHLGDSK